jgi:hypothetical protein
MLRSEVEGNLGLQSPGVTGEVQDSAAFFTFKRDSPDAGPHSHGKG